MAMEAPDIGPAAPRDLCTDCGISRSADAKRCGRACQFIRPDYPTLETAVHGRTRDPAIHPDEAFFGPFRRMARARMREPKPGAQWTGITTTLAERLLRAGAVDAVLTVAPDPDDVWRPIPVLVTDPDDMAAVRGMRMGYAPLLALLEPALERGHKRLAVVGIPCQVYALRALERELGFERLYVIGTPCSDNTTTERFHDFLGLLSDAPETITYLEFRADYHVELRFQDGSTRGMRSIQSIRSISSALGSPNSRSHWFTRPAAAKLDMATEFKTGFEDRTRRIPQGDVELRGDLHSVTKITGATGIPRLVADRDGDGHADRFWAGALASSAGAGSGYQPFEYRPVGPAKADDRRIKTTAGFGTRKGIW